MSAATRAARPSAGVAVALLAVVIGSAGPARAQAAVAPPSQPLVVLLGDHVARTAPDRSARPVETVAGRRPLTRVRTILPVLGERTDSAGRRWLHVRLPGRPNGHKGWIAGDRTRRTSTSWRISIRLSSRRVSVYQDGDLVRRFRAVIGVPSTPTPRGHFFVEEAVALSSRDQGGPFALATGARSPVLQEFAGGPGQIALHGTDGLAGALGTAASHGCVRLSTRAITWLAKHIGGGVPLTITQ